VQRREAEYKAAIANVKAAEAAAMASENRLHLLGMKQDEVDASPRDRRDRAALRHQGRDRRPGRAARSHARRTRRPRPRGLMVLADTRLLWVLADVPEAKLAGIAVGRQGVDHHRLGDGRSEGAAAPKFEGTVAFIAPLVDPTTRTAQVRIEVPHRSRTGSCSSPACSRRPRSSPPCPAAQDPAPVVAVPDEAIQTVEGGPAVFVPVANEPNTFAKRAVTVGKPVGGLVPIYAGLVEGERFVIAGTFILKAELGKGSAAHEH
jgi:cobalt-zinc-cadmium efflux system membrane fusion protein